MIYLISLTVFSAVIITLVAMLLVVEARVIPKGERRIVINADEEKSIKVPGNNTLLAALVNNDIFLPSACGGKGTCGTCKCVVKEGGGDILMLKISAGMPIFKSSLTLS